MLSLKLLFLNFVNILLYIYNHKTWQVLASAHRLATKILKVMVTFQCYETLVILCNDQNSEI